MPMIVLKLCAVFSLLAFVRGGIIQKMQLQLLKISAENRKVTQNLAKTVAAFSDRISLLEKTVLELSGRLDVEESLTKSLQAKLREATKRISKNLEHDRFLYDVIDRDHIPGLRKVIELNPNLPIVLHFDGGKVSKVGSYAFLEHIGQRLDAIERTISREVSAESRISHRISLLENRTESLEQRLSHIYDFSSAELSEIGSGEDPDVASLISVGSGSSEVPQALTTPDPRMFQVNFKNELKKIREALKAKAEKSDVSRVEKGLKIVKTKQFAGSTELEKFQVEISAQISNQSRGFGIAISNLTSQIDKQQTVVNAVKKSHQSYFTKLQSLESKQNTFYTELLSLQVKTGKLQYDILNMTKNDVDPVQREIRLRSIENKIGDLEMKHEELSSFSSTLKESINDCAAVTALDETTSKLGKLEDFLREFRKYLVNLTGVVNGNRGSVGRLEAVLPVFCVRGSGSIQLIKPAGYHRSFLVRCAEHDDQPYLVFQRRFSGKQSFNQSYSDYKVGFGKLEEEFWLGNAYLASLAKNPVCLRISMVDIYGDAYVAKYNFTLAMPDYTLEVSGYHGNATDALTFHAGMAFSTFDEDNDASSTHCAKFYAAGWWYSHCHRANLNGKYSIGTIWYHQLKQSYLQLITTDMMISDEPC